MLTNAPPWDNLKFDANGITESRNKFFGTLYNTYSFFALYANVDEFVFDPANQIPVSERSELDRWIISNSTASSASAPKSWTITTPRPPHAPWKILSAKTCPTGMCAFRAACSGKAK